LEISKIDIDVQTWTFAEVISSKKNQNSPLGKFIQRPTTEAIEVVRKRKDFDRIRKKHIIQEIRVFGERLEEIIKAIVLVPFGDNNYHAILSKVNYKELTEDDLR